MELYASGDAAVIPIILRACGWRGTEFGGLYQMPIDGRPAMNHESVDVALGDFIASAPAKARTVQRRAGQPDRRPARVAVGRQRGSRQGSHQLGQADQVVAAAVSVKAQPTWRPSFPPPSVRRLDRNLSHPRGRLHLESRHIKSPSTSGLEKSVRSRAPSSPLLLRAHRPIPQHLSQPQPLGCRPSRIASTISGAKQVSGRRRQT